MTGSPPLRPWLALVVAVGLGASTLGCPEREYDRLEIRPDYATLTMAFGAELNRSNIVMAEGLVLKAHIVASDEEGQPIPLVVRSLDPSVLEVAGVVTGGDFVFIGKKIGQTAVEFEAGKKVILTVDAKTVKQYRFE